MSNQYKITDIGKLYIQSTYLYNLANTENIPLILTAKTILSECFPGNIYEINNQQFTADQLGTNTKINCLIEDGFIEQS